MLSSLDIKTIISLSLIMVLGECLECYVCHSRQDRRCMDPFINEKSEIVNCSRLRETGLGVLMTSQIFGGFSEELHPLGYPPHTCFKLLDGTFVIRGCSKQNICENYTTFCETCDSDACNGAKTYIYSNYIVLSIISFLHVSIPLAKYLRSGL